MRLKTETQHYVPKFIAISKIFQNLEALGFEPINWGAAPKLETVRVPGGTDLLALAKAGGMSWEQFHQMNPAFRRQVSPPDRQVSVAIPTDKKAPMLAYLENPSALPHAGFIAHEVQKGDNLRKLAKAYHVPQEVICQINGPAAQDMPTCVIDAPGGGGKIPLSPDYTRGHQGADLMDEPLGLAVGNSLEVKEAIATLHGQGPKDFVELVTEAGAIMLEQAKIVKTHEEGVKRIQQAIADGSGFKKQKELFAAQGGDISYLDHPEKYPVAKRVLPIKAETSGFVSRIDSMTIGVSAMKLGAGRATMKDVIDMGGLGAI